MSNLLGSTETLVFLAIAVGSFLAIGGSFLFGGGHGHDLGAGGHDLSHDHGGVDHGVSLFSPQIIFSFTLGFGSAGAIASTSGLALHWSIFIGIGCGVLMAGVAYALMALLYKQQASSIIETSSALGKFANVVTAIPSSGSGEVGLEVRGEYRTYLARSRRGDIAKGSRVKVVEHQGGELVVEPDTR
jgi:membrane protein implicated in regulation of membrane protease activity